MKVASRAWVVLFSLRFYVMDGERYWLEHSRKTVRP